MIYFESVKYRNFLSTGNDWTEISLNRSPSTLIVGQNGSGKSTLLDALSFGLFGRPHRNINKPQLVNTINNKNCEVEIQFTVGKHIFKIVRGIKPAKFEIWQNGIMINQDSTFRDYQKHLEQSILKLNHKSFHQIVVLGSSSFIPFMQLPTPYRRAVIEDLLDIQIFSKMNQLLKEKDSKLKEEITDAGFQYKLINEKIAIQNKYIIDIISINNGRINEKKNQIIAHGNEIYEIQGRNKILLDYINTNSVSEEDQKKSIKVKNSLVEYKTQFTQQVNSLVKESKFYENNDSCPTCTQSISEEIKSSKLVTSTEKAKILMEALEKVKVDILSTEDVITGYANMSNNIKEKSDMMILNNSSIAYIQKQIKAIEIEIELLNQKDSDTTLASNDLDKMISDKDNLSERRYQLTDSKSYNIAASEMLKDTGIKTKIIKQYLPVMNTLINKYLQILDFFVLFNLDENFNETIKSRYRDSFNYSSFSEGEKTRIDLALLFTWRQIAKMKNSTSTNLLVLDETFDSSLDHDGVDNLMKILQTLDSDTNVFVISHKGDLLDGKFRSKITFKKDHNFSKMY